MDGRTLLLSRFNAIKNSYQCQRMILHGNDQAIGQHRIFLRGKDDAQQLFDAAAPSADIERLLQLFLLLAGVGVHKFQPVLRCCFGASGSGGGSVGGLHAEEHQDVAEVSGG